MDILIAIVLAVIGLGALVLGAEGLVRGASSLARRFGIPSLVIGLTVVAFGTSMPELTVNLYAALTGSTDVAIGNIVGSNIANILLILGVAALITPLAVKSSTVRWELPLAFLASLAVLICGSDILLDGGTRDVLTRTDGLLLIGFFIVFLFYVIALTKAEPESAEDAPVAKQGALTSIGLVLLGLAGLVLGGKLLVDNAVVLARLAGLSEAVIGLTVVAIGTSLPELATSVVAAMRREIDIAVGNVVGSNIFNIFWILGLTSTLTPLPATPGFLTDVLVMCAATLALFLAVWVGKRGSVDRWQGGVFIAAYLAYVAHLVI